MGPVEWKSMSSAVSPPDYYDKLSRSQQNIIDTWEQRRGSLIQERTHKQVKALGKVETTGKMVKDVAKDELFM